MPDPAGSPRPAPPLLPARGSLLAFDFGLARIGVALGELETGQATPLQTISGESGAARFAEIDRLLTEWKPVAVVVGIPRHLDGSDNAMTPRCRRFANQLRGRFAVPVLECDERLTSVAADAALKESGQHDWGIRKGVLDAVAAQIILQHFIDTIQHEES